MNLAHWIFLTLLLCCCSALAGRSQSLPGTDPLTMQGDLAAQMVAGIDTYLMREIKASVAKRADHWNRDTSSSAAYVRSVEPNREHLRRILGLQDKRESPSLEVLTELRGQGAPESLIGRGTGFLAYAVRWSVLSGVDAEGLLLVPKGTPVADVIALPDCDATPEMLAGLTAGIPHEAQFARRLAENGCRVLIPFLIDRGDTYSGIPEVRMTNQPHREFLWRAAYEMGRTMIGYEVQKALAAVDWFTSLTPPPPSLKGRESPKRPVGVIGYGEGGLIALYAAAVDTRIEATAVSGYFQPREALWSEPIYRNLFGLLERFGDAEIASLIAPRPLIVEACRHPEVKGPPPVQQGRVGGAAPGAITTPMLVSVRAEAERAVSLTSGLKNEWLHLTVSGNGVGEPGTEATLIAFRNALKIARPLIPSGKAPEALRSEIGGEARRKRQFAQILEHTQRLMRESPYRRAEYWAPADRSSREKWQKSASVYRDRFWDEILGRLSASPHPIHPRSRLVYSTAKFKGYEVVLDVYPGVFAYGILLVPNDLKRGERRPVVVCQHGLEGRPQDVADPKVDSPYYHQFACRLAEQGYITFAPQNPYIGEDRFRVLLRKAQPLKKTLFSFIVRQHERILDWLETLPFVDPKRMAFYGLSYGGKTAMRVPAILERYCLSICSADYNEWIWKNASSRSAYSYLLTGEYDMPEFDLANTFNYAEMSWLISPRPFMVERGHDDGVAPDEWVAHEYARTRAHYDKLGLGARTELEVFDGPHTIHGVGTFAFLRKHLK